MGDVMATESLGIDYSWGRPDPAKIVTSGREFVVRYVSHDTTGKSLTLAEAVRLSNAGLSLVIVFQDSASRMLKGFPAGQVDATFAAQQAAALGMPADRPIYFACDFDATTAQQAMINDYLDGVAFSIGFARTGMYGGYDPIRRALDSRKIAWAWQTYAWSAGRWDSRAQLRQYSNDHILDGVGVDYDRSMTEDYGQWRIGTMTISKTDLDAIAIAVLNKDDVIKTTDGSTANPYRALKTHIFDIGLNVRAIQKILSLPDVPDPAVTTAIIAGVLKGLDGGTGKGMIHQVISGVTDGIEMDLDDGNGEGLVYKIIDGVVAGVLSGPQPAPIDYDLIADKVVERLARRMES